VKIRKTRKNDGGLQAVVPGRKKLKNRETLKDPPNLNSVKIKTAVLTSLPSTSLDFVID